MIDVRLTVTMRTGVKENMPDTVVLAWDGDNYSIGQIGSGNSVTLSREEFNRVCEAADQLDARLTLLKAAIDGK